MDDSVINLGTSGPTINFDQFARVMSANRQEKAQNSSPMVSEPQPTVQKRPSKMRKTTRSQPATVAFPVEDMIAPPQIKVTDSDQMTYSSPSGPKFHTTPNSEVTGTDLDPAAAQNERRSITAFPMSTGIPRYIKSKPVASIHDREMSPARTETSTRYRTKSPHIETNTNESLAHALLEQRNLADVRADRARADMEARFDAKEKRWDNERIRLSQSLEAKEARWNDERKALMAEIDNLRKTSDHFREALAVSEARMNALGGRDGRGWGSLPIVSANGETLDLDAE